MTLENIEKRISDAGRKEIGDINRNADDEIRKIEDEINADALKAYRQVKEKRRQELVLVPRRIVSEAVMENKRSIESKKMEIMKKVFDTAKDRILSMDKEDKKKILKNLADEGKRYVKNPIVYADKEYADLIKANVRDINDFGVVVESEDMTLSINNTLTNVIKRLEPNINPRLAKILFGEN